MKTLNQVIKALELCTDYDAQCDGCPYRDENQGGLECEMKNLEEVLDYLKQFRNIQTLYGTHEPIDFWHNNPARPILLIDGMYFVVVSYSHKYNGCWRCWRMELTKDKSDWTVYDDDNYLLGIDGKLICREIGWRLREEKI